MATRQVTKNIVDVGLANLGSCPITFDADGTPHLVVSYQLVDDQGKPYGTQQSFEVALGANARTTIQNFFSNAVLAAVNAQPILV